MRILHLTPELPHARGGGGGRGHEYLMCRRLVELGHDVLNISPVVPSEANYAQDLRDVGVENWVSRRPPSHVRETVEAMIAEPSVVLTAATAPVRALEMRIFWVHIRALVERAVRDWRPDVVVVIHGMAASWADGLSESMPAVIGLHDLQWHWYLQRAQRRRGPFSLALRGEAERYRRHVLGLLPRYRAAIALSTIEADELRATTRIPVTVIPVGVDTATLRPGPEPAGPPRLVFTGTLDYPPNGQGIQWFADYVWPQVLGAVPNAQLDIIGRGPPPSVQALQHRSGITVVGPVEAMAPYFARAHAVVVPILTGAGIRVKVVEGMAAGRAIVSTSLGWEGLPFVEPGRHLLVADNSQDFASAAIRLLLQPSLREQIARDARLLAERQFDWRRLGDEQEALFRRVSYRDT
jgi:polysaccharide biosynthesis protein PslH